MGRDGGFAYGLRVDSGGANPGGRLPKNCG